MVQSLYSLEVTPIRSKCFPMYPVRLKYYNYYEPIQINVVQSGNYTLSSVGSIYGLMCSLYKEHFNEFIPDERLIDFNRTSCPYDEFKIITELQSSVTYILIMIPRVLDETTPDNFSILASGPNNITFNPISKSIIEMIISSCSRNFH